ncbi:mucin-2 [Sardina pilchardus]|uniref:mucin-2 n=1 Tax=Sardina pilchardus TaxID=27697 RepID=UPI002E103092
MEKPALLFVTSLLLLSSCPRQLHAQATDADAAVVTDGGITAMIPTEPQTELASAVITTEAEPLTTTESNTPEYTISDPQTAPELLTTVLDELVTTTTTEEPTTVTLLQTIPETTSIPEKTTQTTTQIPITIQMTSPGPATPPATSQIIPETTQTTRLDPTSTTPPTVPTTEQSTSTSSSAPHESTSAETTSTAPTPTTLPPLFIPVIPISSKPHPETSSSTTTGVTDSSGTSDSSGTPGGPIILGGSSSADDSGSSSNKSMWLGVIVAGLVAALASIACIALVVRRRRQKQGRGFGDAAVNGRSQRSQRRKGKKKGEEDAWAGPVLMGGADECDGNGYNGDAEEDNNNGGPADGTEPMFGTFAPGEDEEKNAVGAEGTKEAKKWQEQSPLLYIDEDAEEEEEEELDGIPANQQASSRDAQSVEKKGEAGAETGGALDGAVAFCQTTAV